MIDGAIKLQPYSVEKYQRLASIVLWQVHRNTGAKVSCFRDDSWLRNGEKESITFHNASDEFKYELKALTLGMLTHGAGEGMLPVKWGQLRELFAVVNASFYGYKSKIFVHLIS
ncbi:hypothetical protein Q8W14_06025 [Photobacterium damselae subsp. piscicida]|nr:hypothetical protein [Photobacterium damselae subsp. piscicida]